MINLYIGECFSDLETTGVDIFGGWEGADDNIEPLDTADPIVIARWFYAVFEPKTTVNMSCEGIFRYVILIQLRLRKTDGVDSFEKLFLIQRTNVLVT